MKKQLIKNKQLYQFKDAWLQTFFESNYPNKNVVVESVYLLSDEIGIGVPDVFYYGYVPSGLNLFLSSKNQGDIILPSTRLNPNEPHLFNEVDIIDNTVVGIKLSKISLR